MITENSLVIYKNKPAIVKEHTDNKFTIFLADGEQIKVRDKDIELIHPGPVKDHKSLNDVNTSGDAVREAWELLSDEEGASLSLKELCLFIYSYYTPSTSYAAFCLLRDGLFFTGTIDAITSRRKDEVNAEESKRDEKLRETGERSGFLDRLKKCLKNPSANPMHDGDIRFMQDVEALAYGKSPKSKTLRDINLSETPEEAHSVLLKTGLWNVMINPHPGRFSLSLNNPSVIPALPAADEERRDLCHLEAFAIDSPWSDDPDDAVSIETKDGKTALYVHVADPASSITYDCPAEKEARGRGSTLYLPEGIIRMLAEETLPVFALGLSEKSFALSFKMSISDKGEIAGTEIFPSVIKARRITYEEADKLMKDENNDADAQEMRALYELSKKIFSRRSLHGAINIDLPDVRVTLDNGEVKIETIKDYRSSFIVKECMIAAGEGAGTWAASRGLAFPYISQEVELQGKVQGGYAGSMQMRKCMRPRVLSVRPGRHQGLGLDTYTQVTSPLRRYTDLLAHIQIRNYLSGNNLLSADEISARLGYSEAGMVASVHAERASVNHWKMVYLMDKKNSVWDAVAIENKGNRWLVLIPALALEAQVALQRNVSPNDEVKLILKSVNVSKGEAVFLHG